MDIDVNYRKVLLKERYQSYSRICWKDDTHFHQSNYDVKDLDHIRTIFTKTMYLYATVAIKMDLFDFFLISNQRK